MRTPLIVATLACLLTACNASVLQDDSGLTLRPANPAPAKRQLSQSGSVFVAKFATVSALNSRRTFVSDYHGEIRFTLYPNEKIECRFWAEGRVTDESIYEGVNGFIEAYATLCTGRLQPDNTFEFQGAYVQKGPGGASGETISEDEQTFTVKGHYAGETILGDLVVGSVFSNSVTITDADALPDLGEGVRFDAARLE